MLSARATTNWRVNNAMEWWSDHEVKLPHVALMAQKYLAIPASSAPSERVFSQLKLIVERKRWRMDGGRVERVIFLRCNKNFNAQLVLLNVRVHVIIN